MRPHPLGVQPLGNKLLGLGPQCCRSAGLGALAVLSDELLLHVLQHLSPDTLARLCTASRSTYAYCALEELWRAATLEAFAGDVHFCGSWRETYRRRRQAGAAAPPARVTCSGVYSDLLYAPHRCAHVPLHEDWLRRDNVPRESQLSVAAFVERYERTNTPVLLTDVTADWPAFAKWTVHALRTTYGDVGVHAGGFTFAMRDYLAYAEGCESSARAAEDTPLYVFDKAVLLAPGVLAPDFEPPPQFAAQRDLFSLLERDGHPGGRPDHCWLIMGPQRSGSAWHVDPNATSAWNAVVLGCKHWIMFPPGCTPPGVMASDDGAHVAQPSSLVDWYLNFYDACHERGRERMQKQPAPMECNLRSGITLAVTQNLVTGANLSKVLAHLARGDEDLISGIAPEHRASLGPRLLAALHTHVPDVLRAATHSVGPAAGPGAEQWVSGGKQGSGGWGGRAAVNADEGARTFAFNFS